MSASAVARRFQTIDRYQFLGETGFVSDDTEQSALVAQGLARSPRDKGRFLRGFRVSLLGWFARLPWGIGLGTLRACLRIALGLRKSGVSSAGNGAAMRSAILGAFFADEPGIRREWSDALALVTHTDPRAVQGARFVAELAALSASVPKSSPREALVEAASEVVDEPSLRVALDRSRRLATDAVEVDRASQDLGNTGFVVHSVALATFCYLRFGDDPERAIIETIRAGGDTDSNGAIVGGWVGALHGEAGLPARLIATLYDRDWLSFRRGASRPTFAGPTHLRALAIALTRAGESGSSVTTSTSAQRR